MICPRCEVWFTGEDPEDHWCQPFTVQYDYHEPVVVYSLSEETALDKFCMDHDADYDYAFSELSRGGSADLKLIGPDGRKFNCSVQTEMRPEFSFSVEEDE